MGAYWRAPLRLRGTLLAFATGALISALSFELFAEAVAEGGLVRSAVGLIVGAVLFWAIKVAIDARVEHPGTSSMAVMRMAAERGQGLALPDPIRLWLEEVTRLTPRCTIGRGGTRAGA